MVGMSRYHRIAAGKIFAEEPEAQAVEIAGKRYARSDALIDFYRDRTEPSPASSKFIRGLDKRIAKLHVDHPRLGRPSARQQGPWSTARDPLAARRHLLQDLIRQRGLAALAGGVQKPAELWSVQGRKVDLQHRKMPGRVPTLLAGARLTRQRHK